MEKQILFRASGTGAIMPAAAAKTQFTDTCIGKLIEIYNANVYSRTEDFGNKYTEHGLDSEENSITLFSRVKKRMYVKNTERKSNEFVTGEWDLHLVDENGVTAETVDIKSSWSKNTFDKSRLKAKLNQDYYWQGQSYMWLTGAAKHTVAYCLTNASEQTIQDEKRRLAWKMGVIDTTSKINEEYIMKCRQIEINHIYDIKLFQQQNPNYDFDNKISGWCYDIPMAERVVCFEFNRNEADIEKLRLRIIECRTHMLTVLFPSAL